MAHRLADVFFPCVISDLIGGCVEVLGHLNGNMGRIVSSLLTVVVIYPFYWRRIQKKKENRRIAEADGMKEQVSPQIKTTKGEKKWIFLGKNAGCVENPCWGQLRSALCLT